MPSGHTSTAAASAFSTAMLLMMHDERRAMRIGSLTGATAVAATAGYLRVRAGVHHPTDTIAGGLLGAGVGMTTAWMHRARKPVAVGQLSQDGVKLASLEEGAELSVSGRWSVRSRAGEDAGDESEVQRSAGEHEEVPDLVEAKHLRPGVGALAGIDDRTEGVGRAAADQPEELEAAQLGQHEVGGDDTHPAHREVDPGAEPSRTVHPQQLHRGAGQDEDRGGTEHAPLPAALQQHHTGRDVGSADHQEDGDVIQSAQPEVAVVAEIEEVVDARCEEHRGESQAVDGGRRQPRTIVSGLHDKVEQTGDRGDEAGEMRECADGLLEQPDFDRDSDGEPPVCLCAISDAPHRVGG